VLLGALGTARPIITKMIIDDAILALDGAYLLNLSLGLVSLLIQLKRMETLVLPTFVYLWSINALGSPSQEELDARATPTLGLDPAH